MIIFVDSTGKRIDADTVIIKSPAIRVRKLSAGVVVMGGPVSSTPVLTRTVTREKKLTHDNVVTKAVSRESTVTVSVYRTLTRYHKVTTTEFDVTVTFMSIDRTATEIAGWQTNYTSIENITKFKTATRWASEDKVVTREVTKDLTATGDVSKERTITRYVTVTSTRELTRRPTVTDYVTRWLTGDRELTVTNRGTRLVTVATGDVTRELTLTGTKVYVTKEQTVTDRITRDVTAASNDVTRDTTETGTRIWVTKEQTVTEDDVTKYGTVFTRWSTVSGGGRSVTRQKTVTRDFTVSGCVTVATNTVTRNTTVWHTVTKYVTI